MVDLDLWDLTNVVSAPMECDSNKDSVQSNFCVLCRVCKEVSCEESKKLFTFADISTDRDEMKVEADYQNLLMG